MRPSATWTTTPKIPQRPPPSAERPKSASPFSAGRNRPTSLTGCTSSIRRSSLCQPSSWSYTSTAVPRLRRGARDGVGDPGELLDEVDGLDLVAALDRPGAGRRRGGAAHGGQAGPP